MDEVKYSTLSIVLTLQNDYNMGRRNLSNKEDVKMSQLSMHHHYDVMLNNKNEVAKHLLELADCDCDFNGDNGLEYLWEKAEGFESNAEYCISIVKNESSTEKMIEKFVSLLMGGDSYYHRKK